MAHNIEVDVEKLLAMKKDLEATKEYLIAEWGESDKNIDSALEIINGLLQ